MSKEVGFIFARIHQLFQCGFIFNIKIQTLLIFSTISEILGDGLLIAYWGNCVSPKAIGKSLECSFSIPKDRVAIFKIIFGRLFSSAPEGLVHNKQGRFKIFNL
ncbi:hypothetical protein D3C84_669380 [compost metagenome]